MLIYPSIDPVIISFTETIQVRWYGLLYVIGFALAFILMTYRAKRQSWPNWTQDLQFDLFFYIAVGVILGGRVGYGLFYHPEWLIQKPLMLIQVWLPGRSFHGGLVGVILALSYFAWAKKMAFWEVADRVVPFVPIGLACGRLGNFINGELWGRPTDMPWGMVFPHVDGLARHPAQLYGVLLEGGLLFLLLWLFSRRPKPTGAIASLFLLGYGLIRIFEECFRQPDAELGYVAFGWMTQGQLLCIPMVVFGLGYLIWLNKTK